MAARLPLHLARRQPQGPGADLRQSADYDDIGRTVARGRPAVRPLGRAARRGAGAPQTMDVARSGSQGDRGRDAPRMARSGHLADVQHSMLQLAAVPRRIHADRHPDAPPNRPQLQRPGHPAGGGRLHGGLRPYRRRIRAALPAEQGRHPRPAHRRPVAAAHAGAARRRDDLVRHANQVERHTAVHLFPVLNNE